MENLTQSFARGMSLDKDYDRLVREQPYSLPIEPCWKDVEDYWHLDVCDNYYAAVAVQKLWVDYCVEFEAHFEALVRRVETDQIDRNGLCQIMNVLAERQQRPTLIGTVTPNLAQQNHGCWALKVDLSWGGWANSLRSIYIEITDIIQRRASGNLEQSLGALSLGENSETSDVKRAIKELIPPRLTGAEVEQMENEVRGQLELIKTGEQLSGLSIN